MSLLKCFNFLTSRGSLSRHIASKEEGRKKGGREVRQEGMDESWGLLQDTMLGIQGPFTHTHAHTHTRMHTHARTNTRTHMHTHACTHAHARTQVHTCTHAHTHMHTCTHMRTHTRTAAGRHWHTVWPPPRASSPVPWLQKPAPPPALSSLQGNLYWNNPCLFLTLQAGPGLLHI